MLLSPSVSRLITQSATSTLAASASSGISTLNSTGSALHGPPLTSGSQLPAVDPGNYTVIARSSPANPGKEKEVALVSGRQEIEVDLPTGSVKGMLFGLNGRGVRRR